LNEDTRGDGPRTPDRPFDPGREAPLLSAYVDGELPAADRARVEAHLAADPEARVEVARLRRLKEVTDAMTLKEAPPEEWERFWSNAYNRVERGLGWFALTLGAVIAGGFALYRFVQTLWVDAELPWFMKLGVYALCFGVLLLLVSVIRERIFVRKRDRYDDIVR
jgi:predicted anti-sigma-YlaC factor YlaD